MKKHDLTRKASVTSVNTVTSVTSVNSVNALAGDLAKLERLFEAVEEDDQEILKYRLGYSGDDVPCDPLCRCDRCTVESSPSVHINSCDTSGLSLLHFASQLGRLDIVRWLLAHKANVSQRSGLGRTALHYAAQYNHPTVSSVCRTSLYPALIKQHVGCR